MLQREYEEVERQFRFKSDLKIDNYYNDYHHEYDE